MKTKPERRRGPMRARYAACAAALVIAGTAGVVAVAPAMGTSGAETPSLTHPQAIQGQDARDNADQGNVLGNGQDKGPADGQPDGSGTPADHGTGNTPANPNPGAPGPATPDQAAARAEAQRATVKQPTAPEQPFGGAVTVTPAVTVTLDNVQAVQGEARTLGEIAGPALRFTITLTNTGTEPIATQDVVVTADAGTQQTPSGQLSGPDTTALPETIAPGTSATAAYVFNVPNDFRDQVRVFVNSSVDAPVAVFSGSADRTKDNR